MVTTTLTTEYVQFFSITFEHRHGLVRVESDNGLTVAVQTMNVVMISPSLFRVHANCLFKDVFVNVDVRYPLGKVEDVIGASRARSRFKISRFVHINPETIEKDTLTSGYWHKNRKSFMNF